MDQIKQTIIEEFWINRLSGEFERFSLPLFQETPVEKDSTEPRAVSVEIPPAVSDRLASVAKQSDIGLYILGLSALNILLQKYTGTNKSMVGTLSPGNHELPGRLLFLKSEINPGASVKDVISGSKQSVLNTFKYVDIQWETLREQLRQKNGVDPLEVFNLGFLLEPYQQKSPELESFELLVILSLQEDGSMVLRLEANHRLLQGDMARIFGLNLVNTYRRMLEQVDRKIDTLDILCPEEKDKLLYDFNSTQTPYEKHKTFHQLFEEQVEKTPGNTALVGKEATNPEGPSIALSYRQLNEKANQLAHLLLSRGIKPGDLVGLLVGRTIEVMTGILAISKTGGAYLPLDPAYPQERIKYILEDAETSLLLTTREFQNLMKFNTPAIELDDIQAGPGHSQNPAAVGSPTDLIYVIYTSGSTGKPKGVMIQHRALINFVKGITDIITFDETTKIFSLTTVSFDIFGLETLLPLTVGAQVILGSLEEQFSTDAAARVILEEEVSILQITPSRLSILLQQDAFTQSIATLKYLLVGGEALPEQVLEKAREFMTGKIYNMYGPTETTIWSTVKNVGKGEDLTIGKPIANTRVYILGDSGQLQPIGVYGELWITGDGLARGYINKPGMTAEKFIPNPYEAGENLYGTGDLARWLPKGELQFLGRKDFQVKVRGFRVELGEIENQLLKHEDIDKAVVICKQDKTGANFLAAYLVTQKVISVQDVRDFLSKGLPDYMVPTKLVSLKSMPLTPNGKIDRKGLDLLGEQLGTGKEYVPPQNQLEQQIAGVWQEVLGLEKVGIHDNYFELGGTSFDLIKGNHRLKEVLGKNVPVVAMLRHTTVHALANYLNQQEEQLQDRSDKLERGKMDRKKRLQRRRGN